MLVLIITGLYLIGFGAGALFAGPFSETLGRNPVYITTLFLYMIFIMASGLAPNIGAQLAFRFLAGFFGSTPLVCAGGSISDLWSPTERVLAFPVFANAAVWCSLSYILSKCYAHQSTVHRSCPRTSNGRLHRIVSRPWNLALDRMDNPINFRSRPHPRSPLPTRNIPKYPPPLARRPPAKNNRRLPFSRSSRNPLAIIHPTSYYSTLPPLHPHIPRTDYHPCGTVFDSHLHRPLHISRR